MQNIYEVDFGGHRIHYAFRYPQTVKYFMPVIQRSDSDLVDIIAPAEHIEFYRERIPESKTDPYVEYKSLIELTSKALLPFKRCIFHAVAFVWKGYAWLLTAPSGTGKTTQFFHWMHCYRHDVRVISGDMPCLEMRDDGTVWVHSSPWNGKERIKGRLSAPLGGIIFLKQDKANSIEMLSARDCVKAVLCQFQIRPETSDEIMELSRIADMTIRNSFICLLSNRGDEASARLCHDFLEDRFWEAK